MAPVTTWKTATPVAAQLATLERAAKQVSKFMCSRRDLENIVLMLLVHLVLLPTFFAVLDVCASSPCLHGGTCNVESPYYTCSCRPGYIGLRCEIGTIGVRALFG